MAKKNLRKKLRKIVGIEVREISLVDRAASRREFAIVKRDKSKDVQDPELEGLLKEWLDEDLVKMNGAELALKLKDSLKLLSKLKSELPDPVTAAMKTYFAFIAQGAADYGPEPDAAAGDDEADVKDEAEKAKLKKNSDRFPSMHVTGILAGSHKFQKNLRKAAAAADQADDQDQDDADDQDQVDEVEVLKREIARKDRLIEKLSRGKSAQAKTGVDDDEHFGVEKKDSGLDKDGKPTRDLFPSWSLF
jgi:hypothetical protein